MIEGNECKYGKEIREKYGDTVVDSSNLQFINRIVIQRIN